MKTTLIFILLLFFFQYFFGQGSKSDTTIYCSDSEKKSTDLIMGKNSGGIYCEQNNERAYFLSEDTLAKILFNKALLMPSFFEPVDSNYNQMYNDSTGKRVFINPEYWENFHGKIVYIRNIREMTDEESFKIFKNACLKNKKRFIINAQYDLVSDADLQFMLELEIDDILQCKTMFDYIMKANKACIKFLGTTI